MPHAKGQGTPETSTDNVDIALSQFQRGYTPVEGVHELNDELLAERDKGIVIADLIMRRNDGCRFHHGGVALTRLIEGNDRIVFADGVAGSGQWADQITGFFEPGSRPSMNVNDDVVAGGNRRLRFRRQPSIRRSRWSGRSGRCYRWSGACRHGPRCGLCVVWNYRFRTLRDTLCRRTSLGLVYP